MPISTVIPVAPFEECIPKLLVVVDSAIDFSTGDFGLSAFVDALRASTIHGMTPQVITAFHAPLAAGSSTYTAATQQITNFKFDDAGYGLLKSRYDVVFLFGFDGAWATTATPTTGVEAIAQFMQAGGGVFATGDHEDLGAAMSAEVPRVRAMRLWTSQTPNVSNQTRLSTNVPGTPPGGNDIYEFNDQSDEFPQRIYVNYRTKAGGIGNAHPVLQVPGSARAIEVFPDHPHEGECVIPKNLSTTFTLDGAPVAEWPSGATTTPRPEAVALSMSHGDDFPTKQALTPRSFIAICAYDGHAVNVGRVITDATWHHFLNINITGIQNDPTRQGLTARNLADVKRYFVNLATWLMPKKVRKCLHTPLLLSALSRYPLVEELRLLAVEKATPGDLLLAGEQVEAALARTATHAEVASLVADVLESGGGQALVNTDQDGKLARMVIDRVGRGALGGVVLGLAEALPGLAGRKSFDHHEVFDPIIEKAARIAVKRCAAELRRELQSLDKMLDALAKDERG